MASTEFNFIKMDLLIVSYLHAVIFEIDHDLQNNILKEIGLNSDAR